MDGKKEHKERWLSAPLALEKAEKIARRAGGIKEPVGKKLILLAASGKVSALARDFIGTRRHDPEGLQKVESRIAEADGKELIEFYWEKGRARLEDGEKRSDYAPIHPLLWLPLLTKKLGDYHINSAHITFQEDGGFFYYISKKYLTINAPLSDAFSEPFLLFGVKGLFFLEDDLLHVTVPDSKIEELDDSTFDISQAEFVETAKIDRNDDAAHGIIEKGQPREVSKGGRRGAKHGEAIASTVQRLLRLPADHLERYTADSLSLELRQAYIDAGGTPPSPENLARYSAGILRTLRD